MNGGMSRDASTLSKVPSTFSKRDTLGGDSRSVSRTGTLTSRLGREGSTLSRATTLTNSTLPRFQVDDDMRRKLRADSDCTMVTLLQPSESRYLFQI